MAKYVKYNECIVSINEEKIFALNASLSSNSSTKANVVYGGDVETYQAPSELSASVSFEYYVTGESDVISNLTGDISCTGSFGGINFSGAYLTNYSINIEPYMPVTFKADFNIYSGYQDLLSTGQFGSGKLNLANGAHTSLTNINYTNLGMDNPQRIDYTVTSERFPNYVIGEEFPQDVRLGSVVKEISMNGEDIGKVINFSGQDFAQIEMQPETNNNLSRGQLITCNGIIKNQNLSVSKGGLVNGNIEIFEVIR